jgi:hypothetical protein
MSNVCYLPDGTTEYCFTKDDYINIISNKCGRDVEQWLNNFIEELIEEADKTSKIIDTDLRSYEMSLESNATCFIDVLEHLKELEGLLWAKRVNKDKVQDVIDYIKEQINNEI